MGDTITIRLPEALQKRLKERSRRTGLPVNRIVRESIESTLEKDEPAWMKYAGTFDGPKNLSSRKGYSKA